MLLALSLAALPATLAIPFTHSHETSHIKRDGTGSVTSTAGLAWYDSDFTHGTTGKANTGSYTCYSGPASSFPAMSTWINFDAMWTLQAKVALGPVGDSTTEQTAIYNAIVDISQTAKVDARAILAMIILESTGNVRIGCTTSYGGVDNCGLMQSYNPTDQNYDASNMQKSITQMVQDGVQGTAAGPGLVQYFNDATDTAQETHGNAYAVFRSYNSGKVDATNLSDGEGATNAYVSHMANYLQGWDGSGTAYQSCNFAAASTSTPTTSTSTAATFASTAFVAAPTQTVSGSTSHCTKWATVEAGDTCASIESAAGISPTQFRAWNTDIDAACDNLWVNYAYCVSSNDSTSSSSTTSSTPTATATCASSAYVAAPTQTVAGTTNDCCEWYTVKSGDTCATVDGTYGITFAQFRAWNTDIDAACDNLWAGYSYCVSSNNVISSSSSTTTKTSTSSSNKASTSSTTKASTSSTTKASTSSTTKASASSSTKASTSSSSSSTKVFTASSTKPTTITSPAKSTTVTSTAKSTTNTAKTSSTTTKVAARAPYTLGAPLRFNPKTKA